MRLDICNIASRVGKEGGMEGGATAAAPAHLGSSLQQYLSTADISVGEKAKKALPSIHLTATELRMTLPRKERRQAGAAPQTAVPVERRTLPTYAARARLAPNYDLAFAPHRPQR